MARRVRTFTAAMLLFLPAGVGLGAAPAHAVVDVPVTDGGCWTYVPERSAVTPAPDEPWVRPAIAQDAVDPQQSWSSDPVTRISMETAGSTLLAGTRSIRLDVTNGPVLSEDLAVSGKAAAVFRVTTSGADDQDFDVKEVATPAQDFLVEPGERLTDVSISHELPIVDEGDVEVQLLSLYFDAPGALGDPGTVTACNGQEDVAPSVGDGATPGINPATTPEPVKDVTESFTGYESRALVLNSVGGQQAGVTTHARAGDVLELRATGLDTGAAFVAELCTGAELGSCLQSGPSDPADNDGAATASLTLPGDVAVGDAVVRVSGQANFPALDLSVLDVPSVTATEVVGDEDVTLTLSGVSWDPAATVTVAGLGKGGATSDAPVEALVGKDGTFSASFVAKDVETTGVRLTQERTGGFTSLAARQDLVNAVPQVTPPVGEEPPAQDPGEKGPGETVPPTSTTPSTTTPSTTTTSTAPVAAPAVDIPLPGDVPVNEVPAPGDSEAPVDAASELKVSEAYLKGQSSFAEMFGGSSRREVTFLAENAGESAIANPLVRLGVGRTADVDPAIVAAEVGELAPGARVAVSVDVALPMASFGVYQVVGQVGDSADNRFALEWQTYPWGLIALNLLGIALLAWGLVHRQRQRTRPAPSMVSGDDAESGASVVDLTALDRWWATGKVAPRVEESDDNDSVVDLDAADRWWARRGSRVS